jgi:hypothetical protein
MGWVIIHADLIIHFKLLHGKMADPRPIQAWEEMLLEGASKASMP